LTEPLLTIRPMTAQDDIEAELDLRYRAFGPMDAAERGYWLTEVRAGIADQRQYGVWDGGRLIGAARFYDMRQWWRGRSLPMAGVAGVKVAPEARGLGAGRALMTELLRGMAERGYVLSTLYPATAQLYRSLGWEMAGGHYVAEIPARSLLSLLPPDPEVPANGTGGPSAPARPDIRRATPADAEQMLAVFGAVYRGARDCGPCTWDLTTAGRWLARSDLFAYLAPDGFLAYGWDGGHHDIKVDYLTAGSPETARALWGIVASHASVTEVVRAAVSPADPITWLTREPDVNVRQHKTWMLRVLDPRAAVAGRGFPAGAVGKVALLLADPDLPAGAGLHTLSVRDGEGSLTPGINGSTPQLPAAPPVMLGPRGFAAMFAGVPMATLRLAGLAAGGDQGTDEALDTAFAGRPYLLDYF
jgi:predicted acetyltransferase